MQGNRISATIAHTYKYTERTARLSVEPVVPERRQGKYDAQVDSLISLGEVTLKGETLPAGDVRDLPPRETVAAAPYAAADRAAGAPDAMLVP